VPSSQDICAALTLHGSRQNVASGSAKSHQSPWHVCQNCGSAFPAERELPAVQALGQRVSPGELMPSGECPECGALCHLEAPEGTVSSYAMPPAIVIFVEGGVVQSVEGQVPVRVILCDFDVTDGAQKVGGRPCHIGVCDSTEEPSDAFEEVLSVVARKKPDANGSSE